MNTGQGESKEYQEEVLSTSIRYSTAGLFTQSPVLQKNYGDLSKVNSQTLSVVYSSGCKNTVFALTKYRFSLTEYRFSLTYIFPYKDRIYDGLKSMHSRIIYLVLEELVMS